MKNWYFDTFAADLLAIEQHLREFVARWPKATPLFWQMIDHHFGWTQADDGQPRLSGKRVRPLLMLLVARALTSRTDHVMPAAASIELVHNFTLIHDDVMDRSVERRHRETLWSRWGTAQAINAGDGLYAIGMSAMLDLVRVGVPAERAVEAIDLLLKACVATVEGQMLDVGFEDELVVTTERYLTMIFNKSGALIECSARLGALLSTDEVDTVVAYGAFGKHLGIAFQIWDDYLGVWGRPELTGKSATTDIEGRKKSYPVLIAFEQASGASRQRLEAIYRQDAVTAADVQTVLEILIEVNAVEQTRALIDTYFQQAIAALDSVGIDNEPQRQLRRLAEFLVDRAY